MSDKPEVGTVKLRLTPEFTIERVEIVGVYESKEAAAYAFAEMVTGVTLWRDANVHGDSLD